MKQTTTAKWRVIALASIMTASGNGMAALSSDSETPRQENYANYSLYIQALFHNWKMQEDKAKADSASTSCSNEKSKIDDSSSASSNSCTKESATISKIEIPGGDQYESLDDALDKRTADIRPDYASNKELPRTTFNSFPLNPITALDLEEVTAGDLLGIFNSLIYKSQTSDSANNQLANNNRPSGDNTQSIYGDITSELYKQIFGAAVAFGGLLEFKNISGRTELYAEIIDHGMRVNLDADVRVGLYIVDRDGIPNTSYAPAGAIDIDSMGIKISNLSTELKANSNTGSNIIEIKAHTPNAITVDLSNTKIGVADAVVDGSQIGSVTPILSFGPDSTLTVGPGVSISSALTAPDGLKSPLLTINGDLGKVSLHGLSLLDQGQSVFHIGTISMDGLKLVNTRVFFDGPKMIIDMGTGITNANLAIERLSLGYGPEIASLGDFYVSHIRLINSRIIMQPH